MNLPLALKQRDCAAISMQALSSMLLPVARAESEEVRAWALGGFALVNLFPSIRALTRALVPPYSMLLLLPSPRRRQPSRYIRVPKLTLERPAHR